jgi:hypothetical protein
VREYPIVSRAKNLEREYDLSERRYMTPSTDSGKSSELDFLKAFLSESDEVCPLCRYALRGMTSCTCPECGKELVIRIGLREPSMVAFLVGTIALAAATGFNLIFATMLLMERLFQSPFFGIEYFIGLSGGAFVTGSLLAIWIRMGRKFRLASSRVRVVLAVFAVFIPIVNLMVMYYFAFGL